MLRMLKSLNRDKIAKCLMLFSALVFGLLIPGRFSVTTTPSLVHRIYLISKISDAREIRKEGYVLFVMRKSNLNTGLMHEVMGNKATSDRARIGGGTAKITPVMKIARCLPGERLEVSDRMYYCNGEYLGKAKEYSLRGEKVDNFVWDGVVPSGRIFVMGEHRDSLDSRYFGFIEAKDVIAVGHPLY